jgi:hypothetical protein
LATGALIILDDMLVCDFQVEDIVPEPKHAPEMASSRPRSPPNRCSRSAFGGDQQEVLSQRYARLNVLPSAALRHPRRRPGSVSRKPRHGGPYGNEFLVVPVHPAAPNRQHRTSGGVERSCNQFAAPSLFPSATVLEKAIVYW